MLECDDDADVAGSAGMDGCGALVWWRIGALGFTGQASTPHLHFHVADANAPLAAEGMPYHFTRYRLLGVYRSISEFGNQPWQPLPAARVILSSLPAANVVVSFE